MPLRILPVCPHCGSRKLSFMEQGSGVSVFQCQGCVRTTVERAGPVVPMVWRRPVNEFRFPSWFTGAVR
jgi:hypothetical protein